MQQVYSNVTKVMADSKQGSNLLYLPLDKLLPGKAQAINQLVAATNGVTPPGFARYSRGQFQLTFPLSKASAPRTRRTLIRLAQNRQGRT